MSQIEDPTLRRVLRVLDYIHEHAGEDLSLDTLAEVAALSRFHWHRVFQARTGMSPGEAIRAVRLHKATMLLVRSDRPIPEIAKTVGYVHQRSFSRAFRDQYGMTPLAFRERGQAVGDMEFNPKQGEIGMFDVKIKEMDTIRMAALAHRGNYSEGSKSFQKAAMLIGDGPNWAHVGRTVGVYYDDPSVVPEADLRSHAGFEWMGEALPDGFEEVTLSAGRYAVLRLKGPYSGLPAAYDHLFGTWLQGSGEVLRDAPSFELYPNSPMDTAPDELLTDICVPLDAKT